MKASGRRADEGSEEYVEVCTPCHSKGRRLEAQGYCRDCKEHLCSRCYDCHTVPSAMAHHQLMDKSKMPRGQASATSTDTPTCKEACAKHTDKFIEFICIQHNHLGCRVCIAMEHSGCTGSISYIPDVAHNVSKNQEYKDLMKQIQDMKIATKNVNARLESNMEISEKEGNAAIADMMKLKQELNTFIDKSVENMRRKIESLKGENKAILEYRVGSCNSIVSAVDHLETEIKAKQNQEADLFISIKRGKAPLDEMSEEVDKFCNEDGIRRYKFVPNETIKALMRDPTFELGSLQGTGQQSKQMQGAKQKSQQKAHSQCVSCDGQTNNNKILPCSHVICWACLDQKEKNMLKCPACRMITGNQPDGTMKVKVIQETCWDVNGITINYQFANGIQRRDHPRPGAPIRGREVTVYLQNNEEGWSIHEMLERAWERKLLFTVQSSGYVKENGIDLWKKPHNYCSDLSGMTESLRMMGVTK